VLSLFAVALAGTGLLTTVGVIVAMDTFGPISDNAQGVAEMSGEISPEGAEVLTALDAYLSEGGGSRGARAICDPEGSAVPITRLGPLEAYRFRGERTDDRARKTFVRLVGDSFVCDPRPIRRRDRAETAYFERDWGRFLSGAIFEDEGTQKRHKAQC